MEDNRKKSFLELGKGAIMEQFDYELEKVIDNILDINTPAKKARKVTLTLTLTPDDSRQQIYHDVVVKSNVQPTNPISGATAIVPDQNGVVSLVEMTPQLPGQIGLGGTEQHEPDIIQFTKNA